MSHAVDIRTTHTPSNSTTTHPLTLQVLGQQCVTQTTAVTDAQYTAMYTALSSAMGPVNNNLPAEARGDLVGGVVRLTFHDAGEIDIRTTDTLGVDGCVDTTLGGNAGLAEIIATLETIRAPFCSIISRADWWVLAGKVAVELRANGAGSAGYTVPFRFGRTDATGCADTNGRLPSAQGGVEEITRVFVTQMGLTFRDAAALLGAHSLGRAQPANSG